MLHGVNQPADRKANHDVERMKVDSSSRIIRTRKGTMAVPLGPKYAKCFSGAMDGPSAVFFQLLNTKLLQL